MSTQTAMTIRAGAGAAALSDPLAAGWDALPASTLPLEPTPLDAQPSAYVRRSWEDRSHGAARQVSVSAATVGERLLVRLRWETAAPVRAPADINQYPDACAVLFPLDGTKAEIDTMGSEEQPVCGWHWRAGSAEAFAVTAQGLGTVERLKGHDLEATGEWSGGAWHVTLAGPLGGSTPPISREAALPIGVAVWTGAGDERAGLKAHTPTWHSLSIGAEE
ncbi:MAG: ethylbenzene dehydrogenase-related protein [Dehalococcoidia bacterium]